VTPFPPTYIPPQVCATVGQDPATPPDACMSLVFADVREDGVSASASQDKAGLASVVADAKQKGIDLKIVVLDQSPPIDTPLRDIATEVGEAYPGSTVLAMSPTWAGTYSTDFDRVTLEAGQDIAKNGDPVQSSKNFVSELTTPHFPWTAFSIVLTLLVLAAAVATRLLQVRSKRAAAEMKPDTAE